MPLGLAELVAGGAAAVAFIKAVFTVKQVPASVQGMVRSWKRRPTLAERDLLLEHANRLDARRVFSAPFHAEVVEACVASLDEVRRFTDETVAKLKHPGARVMLEAIREDIRSFLDKWHRARTPRHFDLDFGRREGSDAAEFFKDLGTLRERVQTWRSILASIEPGLAEAAERGEEHPQKRLP